DLIGATYDYPTELEALHALNRGRPHDVANGHELLFGVSVHRCPEIGKVPAPEGSVEAALCRRRAINDCDRVWRNTLLQHSLTCVGCRIDLAASISRRQHAGPRPTTSRRFARDYESWIVQHRLIQIASQRAGEELHGEREDLLGISIVHP